MVPSHSSNASEPSGSSASRRTVLRLAGATAGMGLVAGRAAAETGPAPEPATVGVSPGQHAVVEEARNRLEDPRAGALSVETIGTTAGFRGFADGDVELLVGSRPILAGERARVLENDRAYEAREVPTSVATLDPPATSWNDCLRPARLAATWSSDDEVDTWAEVPSAPGSSTAERVAPSAGDEDLASHPTSADATIVRGVRSHQYATGAGGVGYYEPELDWIDAEAGTDKADATTLVRLSYLYGDRAILDGSAIAPFLDAYGQVSSERVGDVAYFADPYGQ